MTFTQDLLDALAPMMYAEGQTGNALADYLGGLGKEFELVETWASDTDTDVGWSLLLDIDKCPVEALPWLAQIVGLTLPSGLSAADQRSLIKTTPNWKRGTVGALQGAAAPFLTGNKTVILRERYDGSGNDAPYYLQVITYASETPVEDWPATNYETNGGFETNANNYAGEGASTQIARILNEHYAGIASLQVGCISAPASGYLRAITTLPPINPQVVGTTYTVSCYVKAESGQTVGKIFTLRPWDGASPFYTQMLLSGAWQRISCTWTAVNTAGITLYMGLEGQAAINDYFGIDNIQVEASPAATPYIPTDGAIASRPAGQGLVGKALLSQKAGGIIMTYNVVFGQDYQLLKTNNATYQLVKNRYPTYAGVKSATGV